MSHEEYKVRLEADLETITAELEPIAVQNPETGDWVAKPEAAMIGNADPDLTADATEDWNERRALMTQLETRYHNIKRALQKITDGTYGVCEISGDPIEADRLDANPAARTNKANLERESELFL